MQEVPVRVELVGHAHSPSVVGLELAILHFVQVEKLEQVRQSGGQVWQITLEGDGR